MSGFRDLMTARKLVNWMNKTLESDVQHIEELCTGAAYCQMMDILFSNSVPLSCVLFTTNHIRHFKRNFYLLRNAFQLVGIPFNVAVDDLIRGNFKANLIFAKKFYKFFNSIMQQRVELFNQNYKPDMARGGSKLRPDNPEIVVRTRSAQTLYAIVPWSGNEANEDKLMKERIYYMKLLSEIEDLVAKHKQSTIKSEDIQALLYKVPQPFDY